MNESLISPRSIHSWIGASLFSVVLSVLLLAASPFCEAAEKGKKSDKSSVSEKKKSPEKRTRAEKNSDSPESGDEGEDLFLREGKDNQKFLPDIFRCPECGYEQDEPGTCPDHDESALILVRSKGKNPLEPSEVDGNEDIIVDIPLTGLSLKKSATASGTVTPVPAPKAANRRNEKEASKSR